MSQEPELRALLAEQQRYYRERAPRYLEGALTEFETAQLERALNALIEEHCRGDVLELACGPGTWTARLARHARHVTALDGAPEMLELARASEPGDNVDFVQADIFGWRPDRRYDAIFFGFWLSHVPEERFAPFWATVADALAPGGHALFVDDAHRTPEEEAFGPTSAVVVRTLHDGRRHRVVKVPHTAGALQARLEALGWRIRVDESGPFYWGVAARP